MLAAPRLRSGKARTDMSPKSFGSLVLIGFSLLLSGLGVQAVASVLCGFAQVSTGEEHTCAVRPDGTVE